MRRWLLSLASAVAASSLAPVAVGGPPEPGGGAGVLAEVHAPSACDARKARAAEVAKVAAHPSEFAGMCLRLKGFWRDFAMYPTRAEAAQPDAMSIATLDQRRVGLYLAPEDLGRAPTQPRPSTVVGRVGDCAGVEGGFAASGTAYCRYKGGAFLKVDAIEPAP